MSTTIDTSRVIEFNASREPVILALGLLNLIILFSGLALGEWCGYAASMAASAIFAAWANARIWKLLKNRKNIVTITPSGIRDRRLMEEFIPWRAVRAVRLKVSQGSTISACPMGPAVSISMFAVSSSVIELDVDPVYISKGGDWTLRKRLTIEIGVEELRTDGPALCDICKAYAAASRHGR